MNIDIISVGRIKESYLRDAAEEYKKRLSRFADINIIEIPDEKIPDNASQKEEESIKNSEGEQILRRIRQRSFVVSLCIEGRQLSSAGLSEKIGGVMLENSSITFVIGGSLGLSDAVKKASDYRLSFSEMTFPHQLMRVILLEQLYRAFKIMKNEPYHK